MKSSYGLICWNTKLFLLGEHFDKIFMRSGCSSRKGFDSKGWKMKKLKQLFIEEKSEEKERLKRKGKKGNHIVFWKRNKE